MKIAGVRFRTAGKIYYFDQGNLDLQVDNHCIVETQRGLEYGKIVFVNREMDPKDSKYPIKPIIRKSTVEDDFAMMENKKKESHPRISVFCFKYSLVYTKDCSLSVPSWLSLNPASGSDADSIGLITSSFFSRTIFLA